MSLLPRRITFQLTPLLDLLLIVIFAQFLEVRDRTEQTQNAAEKQSSQNATELVEAKRDRDALQARLTEAQALADQLAELKRRLADEAERMQRMREQRDAVAATLAQMFRLPASAMKAVLKPLVDNDAQSKADVAKLQKMMQDLQKGKPHEMVRHVVKFRELLKRCDIWEIHIDRRNIASLDIGGKADEFRYSARPLKLTGDEDKDREDRRRYFRELTKDFEDKLFALYKDRSPTKNVIIVLISRGPRTTAGTYLAAKQGIRDMTDHVALQSGAKIDVVFTDLGELRFKSPGDREKK